MAEATESQIEEAAFTRSVNGTLLVFYDAYDSGSLEWYGNEEWCHGHPRVDAGRRRPDGE